MTNPLKKSLRFIDVFAIATGAMISSGIFILPGLAHAKAGPGVIFSYFFAGLLALPGMFSILEMTTAMPKAGGDCFSIIRSMGPAVGTVAGLLSWFSLSMKSAFALLGISIFATEILPWDIRIMAILFCIIFMLINLIGIKEAGRTQVFLVSGLLLLIIIYIVRGIPEVRLENLSPFVPNGFNSIFTTAGFVFVAYGGLLKVASVAEEIKNPGKNIPAGMIYSLVITVILYVVMVFVTTGVMDSARLDNSLTPISDGAEVFMGQPGRIALSIAAILAFLSTANAGIMTAARSLVPLSHDLLLPAFIGNINKKFRTPHYSLLITGIFIITSLLLNLEILVKAASAVLILVNILSCISVIILRESHISNYQPVFKTPFYPWLPLLGTAGLVFLLWDIGQGALLISCLLIISGFSVYFFYGRKKVVADYALMHLIERIINKKLTDGKLEQELKEIVRVRDNIISDRFDELVEQSEIIDINRALTLDEFFKLSSDILANKLKMSPRDLNALLHERESESSTIIARGLAIPHIIVEGNHIFEMLVIRCKAGIRFKESEEKVTTVFILIGSKDERNFHLRVLSAIAQIIQDPDFEKKWNSAKNVQVLKDQLLLTNRKR